MTVRLLPTADTLQLLWCLRLLKLTTKRLCIYTPETGAYQHQAIIWTYADIIQKGPLECFTNINSFETWMPCLDKFDNQTAFNVLGWHSAFFNSPHVYNNLRDDVTFGLQLTVDNWRFCKLSALIPKTRTIADITKDAIPISHKIHWEWSQYVYIGMFPLTW